jgi:hypothetical protein
MAPINRNSVMRRSAAVVSNPLELLDAAVLRRCSAAVAAVPGKPLKSFNAAVCGGCAAVNPHTPRRAYRPRPWRAGLALLEQKGGPKL